METTSQPRACLKNAQIQDVESAGCETYVVYGEHHVDDDNAGFGSF